MASVNENDLLYEAWGVIANVSEGDWEKQPEAWQMAAVNWRERWHRYLDETRGNDGGS